MRANANKVFIVIAGALMAACGSDTGRARVDFDVTVQSQQLSGAPNEFGYTVQLTRATFTPSRLAFFEGEPLFTKTLPQRLGDWLIAPAYAHPGHYTPGEALGDILVERQFDLLNDAPMPWGRGIGVTGDYASAELDLGNATSAAIVLEGTATDAAGTIPFTATLDGTQQIIGLTAGFEVEDVPVEIVLHVDLNAIVERIDFGRAAPGDEVNDDQAPLPLVRDTQPFNAFSRASIGNGTYRFEMKETE